ncbi:hypothetical protein Bca101_022241 [Brassica carinata]
MEASSFRKKFKKHGKLSEATEYYVNAFGAVKIGSFDPPPCVELFLAGTTLVISEKVVEPYSGITLQVTVGEVRILTLMKNNNLLDVTPQEGETCQNTLSFQEWTQQMKDMLEARKRGDQAFREKDFKTAIDYAALRDAMQAQCVYPDWPTAFYMQSVALAKLNMNTDAADMLNEAAQLEEKRQRGGGK